MTVEALGADELVQGPEQERVVDRHGQLESNNKKRRRKQEREGRKGGRNKEAMLSKLNREKGAHHTLYRGSDHECYYIRATL